MALQTSGTITLQDIADEFPGTGNPIKLSEYYRGGGLVPDFSLNNSVPTSGTIAVSDFYGATNGVSVDYSATGAGGGGGYGVANGAGTGSAGAGSASTITVGGTIVVTADGGPGGVNGRGHGTGSGENGFDSALGTNTGGAGGAPNSNGRPGNRGGGGGGAGGDAPSRYDRSGGAGAGGEAGLTETGTIVVAPGTIEVQVGTGGTGGNSNYDGGRGGNGEVTITQARSQRDRGVVTNLPLETVVSSTTATNVTIYPQPIIGADIGTSFKSFYDYIYLNSTNENDTDNPYSVTEIGNFGFVGSGRLYIGHKNDYSSSTFYNDTPIAAIQVLDQTGNQVIYYWWFGGARNVPGVINQRDRTLWETHQGYINGPVTGWPISIGDAASRTYYDISTSYSSTRWMSASSTGSSLTGAVGGIENDWETTPMPLGQETIPQSGSRNYIFREVSGTNPRYSVNWIRTKSNLTWEPGYRIRVAYIIGNRSSGTYDIDEILWAAVR